LHYLLYLFLHTTLFIACRTQATFQLKIVPHIQINLVAGTTGPATKHNVDASLITHYHTSTHPLSAHTQKQPLYRCEPPVAPMLMPPVAPGEKGAVVGSAAGSTNRPRGSLEKEKPRWPGAGDIDRLRESLFGEPTDRDCTVQIQRWKERKVSYGIHVSKQMRMSFLRHPHPHASNQTKGPRKATNAKDVYLFCPLRCRWCTAQGLGTGTFWPPLSAHIVSRPTCSSCEDVKARERMSYKDEMRIGGRGK